MRRAVQLNTVIQTAFGWTGEGADEFPGHGGDATPSRISDRFCPIDVSCRIERATSQMLGTVPGPTKKRRSRRPQLSKADYEGCGRLLMTVARSVLCRAFIVCSSAGEAEGTVAARERPAADCSHPSHAIYSHAIDYLDSKIRQVAV